MTADTAPLVAVEAALAPHVLDLLATAGVAGSSEPRPDSGLLAIAVPTNQLERARATLDLVLPGLLEPPAGPGGDQGPGEARPSTAPGNRSSDAPLSGRLIRRADWPSEDESDQRSSAPQPWLLDGRAAFAEAVSGSREPRAADPLDLPPIDDEDDFVPLEPPPLPRGDTTSRFAWLGAIGGPLLMVTAALLGLPTGLAAIGLAGFVLGFGVLVARMPDRPRQDDGWDDGAVL